MHQRWQVAGDDSRAQPDRHDRRDVKRCDVGDRGHVDENVSHVKLQLRPRIFLGDGRQILKCLRKRLRQIMRLDERRKAQTDNLLQNTRHRRYLHSQRSQLR